MKEIKQKFVDAINSTRFEKLSVNDLNTLADVVNKIKDLDRDPDAYINALTKGFAGSSLFSGQSKETLKDLR